jgi:pyruvate-formate lyase
VLGVAFDAEEGSGYRDAGGLVEEELLEKETFVHVAIVLDRGASLKALFTEKAYSLPMSRSEEKRYDRMGPRERVEYLSGFTRAYLGQDQGRRTRRESACLAWQFPAALGSLKPGDRIAGSRILPPIGLSPQEGGLGYYFDEAALRALGDSLGPDEEERRAELDGFAAFWSRESTAAKVRAAYTPDLDALLPPWSDRYQEEPIVGSGLYRMSGSQPDYDKLVRLGLPGLESEIESSCRLHLGAAEFFAGLLCAIGVFKRTLLSYAEEAAALARTEPDGASAAAMVALESRLRALRERAPASLAEGFQLVWLYSLLSGSINYGRLDEALGDLLAAELEEGSLDWEGAVSLALDFWRAMDERGTTWDARVVVGGRGRRNPRNADLFARLALDATERARSPLPQLSLRFYEGQDPVLLDRAFAIIASGNPYPILYNDDANVPAVEAAFGVSRTEAEQYVPFGCGEYVLYHRGLGTPSGILNLSKALETVLGEGRCLATGRELCPSSPPLESHRGFEDLWGAYAALVERYVAALAEQEALEYRVVADEADFLFLSLLYDDCLERGLPILGGGARYLGGTIELYGLVNAADSLTAIRRAVYEEGSINLRGLAEALSSDFAGKEELRATLAALPKYGNDDDEADAMLLRVHEHACWAARENAERAGLDSYLAVVINNSANTILGRHTGAGADGRSRGETMANGNAAHPGRDSAGLTALLNSLLKPRTSIHAGAVQNLKFSKEAFVAGLSKTRQVLAAYFRGGGAQAMITVVGRGDLEDAYVHPEAWPNLLVRVGGFSARFVELERDVQREILDRTLY